jgi:hypothetical protein
MPRRPQRRVRVLSADFSRPSHRSEVAFATEATSEPTTYPNDAKRSAKAGSNDWPARLPKETSESTGTHRCSREPGGSPLRPITGMAQSAFRDLTLAQPFSGPPNHRLAGDDADTTGASAVRWLERFGVKRTSRSRSGLVWRG